MKRAAKDVEAVPVMASGDKQEPLRAHSRAELSDDGGVVSHFPRFTDKQRAEIAHLASIPSAVADYELSMIEMVVGMQRWLQQDHALLPREVRDKLKAIAADLSRAGAGMRMLEEHRTHLGFFVFESYRATLDEMASCLDALARNAANASRPARPEKAIDLLIVALSGTWGKFNAKPLSTSPKHVSRKFVRAVVRAGNLGIGEGTIDRAIRRVRSARLTVASLRQAAPGATR